MLLTPYSTAFGDRPSWAANDGQGAFAIARAQALPSDKMQITDTLVADLDLDGDNDLVLCNGHHMRPSPAEVLFNDGDGNLLS